LHDTKRIAVVGGGVIGLSVAWRLARDGHDVHVFDAGGGAPAASRVAGGMLAPVSEYGFDHDAFYTLGEKSLSRFPAFLDELEADCGVRVPLGTSGALMVARDRDDTESIRRLYRFREGRGLPVEWLTGSEARELEPLLSPRVSGGMWIPDDYEVDNRALLRALAAGLRAKGGTLHENTPVTALHVEGGRALGVSTAAGDHAADVTVLAAGAWSGSMPGVPADVLAPVRPVKGQIVSLRLTHECPLGRVIRTPDCYMVPKGDGRLVVGASEEEMGFDTTATAGPVFRLLERAWEVLPAIYELPIESIDVGLRPGTRDHLPVIGPTRMDGLIVAAGHYRHGILLAPATADAVAAGVREGFDPELAPFSPARFDRTTQYGTQGQR
jgi:glycine oxidase